MYRVICNSLKNYASDFSNDKKDPRYRPVYFLRLIEDLNEYLLHKERGSEEYRLLSGFLWEVRDCERSSQILHELKMLGIEGTPDPEGMDFTETIRIWRMFVRKAYWRD